MNIHRLNIPYSVKIIFCVILFPCFAGAQSFEQPENERNKNVYHSQNENIENKNIENKVDQKDKNSVVKKNSNEYYLKHHYQNHQYKHPLQSIRHLLHKRESHEYGSEKEYFEDQIKLIELYFKTEQYQLAEEILTPLEQQFSNQKEFHPRLALVKAHMMLHNRNTDNFLDTLAPYVESYQDDSENAFNACYLYLLGSYQIKKNQFSLAFASLTQALEKATAYEFSHLEIGIKNKLVQLYYYTQNYEKALKLTDQIIELATKNKDDFSHVLALSNKMNLYYVKAVQLAESMPGEDIANNPLYKSFINSSKRLQQQVYLFAKSIGARRTMTKALILKQSHSFGAFDYEQAIIAGKEIGELAKQYNLGYENAVTSNNMAIAYRELGEFDKSIEALKVAEENYSKIGNLQSLIWIYDDYAKTYERAGDFEKALEYYKKFHETSLNFSNKTNNQTLLELQEKYAAKEKTQEISRLTQQAALDTQQLETEKMGRWLLSVILTAVFAIALILFQKRKRLKLMLRKEAKLNQQIVEANEAKQRFFANISHEFRTALTLSIGPLKKLLSEQSYANNPFVESALENNLHMMTLINEVLDIEKIEARALPMQVSKFDIVQATNNCLNRFLLQFREKQIHLKKYGFEQKVDIHFDPSHFEKVVANILSNAAKYCVGDCTIKITLMVEADKIDLEICDDGPGICKSELPYLFNRFYQGKSSSDKHLPGTGIGLSMVKELIEMHQGGVKICSELNKGCCVTLSFKPGADHYAKEVIQLPETKPLEGETKKLKPETKTLEPGTKTLEPEFTKQDQFADAKKFDLKESNSEANLPKVDHNETEEINNKHRKVILVVDDNPSIRQLIRSILQPEFHIVEAGNGQQGLELAESIQPDLVIVDVMMPLMNGFQLTEQLRKNQQLSHLSIILLTALSESEQRVHGLVLGADDYVTKPFDNDELKARVKCHLAQKQRLSNSLFEKYQNVLDKKLPSQTFDGQDSKRSRQLDELIAKNLSKCEFDVEQMYTALNMTRSSLYRYTQKKYGCSPMNLLKVRRLELAYQMLREYHGTISEVAYAVGYQSLSAFSRAFREHYKHPPTQVKRQQAAVQEVKV